MNIRPRNFEIPSSHTNRMTTVLMRGSRMQPQMVINKSYNIFIFDITKLNNETKG